MKREHLVCFFSTIVTLNLILISTRSSQAFAQLECKDFSNNRESCTDVIGLENSEITLQNKDITNGSTVVFGEQEYCILSYTRPSPKSNPNAWNLLPFDVQLDGNKSNNTFILENSNNQLPVSFKWKGGAPVNGASVWESPGPGNLTSDQQGGKILQ